MTAFAQSQAESEINNITGRSYGVLSDMLDEVVKWATSLDFEGLAVDALDAAYHWVVEWLLPKLMAKAPSSINVVMGTIIIPLLKKIHDAHLPH